MSPTCPHLCCPRSQSRILWSEPADRTIVPSSFIDRARTLPPWPLRVITGPCCLGSQTCTVRFMHPLARTLPEGVMARA